jgi:hypothetical protein
MIDVEEQIVKDFNNKVFLKELSKKYQLSLYKLRIILKKYNLSAEINRGKGRGDCTCNSKYFNKIDTNEKAYWLGLLFADGYISTERAKGIQFKMSLGLSKECDKSHIYKFSETLESTHKIVIVQPSSRPNKNGKIINRSIQHRVDIHNKELVTDLINLGLTPRKSNTCEFPNIDDQYLSHFIRGYFDGDGSLCGGLKINIIGSIQFITTLANKLDSNFNIKCKIQSEKRCENMCYLLIINKSKMIEFLEMIYKDSSVHLDRKYQQFLNMKESQRLPFSHLKVKEPMMKV